MTVRSFDDVLESEVRARGGYKWWVEPGILSASIAEMDYAIAEPIRQKMLEIVNGSRLGYPTPLDRDALRDAFVRRMSARYGWQVDRKRIEVVPDVLQGMSIALHQLLADGDEVIVQTPVYAKFFDVVKEANRVVVVNELRRGGDGRYEMDLEHLRTVIGPRTRALFLCNPQNPTGRVFDRTELEALGQLVVDHDLLLISDEIHAELIYPGFTHVPAATLSAEIAARTITVTSATKAFNIPGVRCAVVVFGAEALQARYRGLSELIRTSPNVLGIHASCAAWTDGDPWLAELIAYLDGNRRRVEAFAAEHLPAGRHAVTEATYLAWLDCRELGLEIKPGPHFLEDSRVAVVDGEVFGAGGQGFIRFNFATSRALLEQMLERLGRSIGSLRDRAR